MDNLKFRLKVHKMKCVDCDSIFLLEEQTYVATNTLACPICELTTCVEEMGHITVVEEIAGELEEENELLKRRCVSNCFQD